ncbi:MAG: dUTP diphosphatase [Fusobacteriaceae bacterium]
MELKILSGKLTKAHITDAGYDIHSSEDVLITPNRPVEVATNLRISIPEGYYGKVESRSGLSFKNNIEVGAGVIDCGYTAEIKIKLYNHGSYPVTLPTGSRIAQIIFMKHEIAEIEMVEDLEETERGEKGFGSSGI